MRLGYCLRIMQVGRRFLCATAVTALALVPLSAVAMPELTLSAASDAYYCTVGNTGVFTIYALFLPTSHIDPVLNATTLSCSVGLTPGSGYVYLGSSSPYTVLGDPRSGCEVSLGSCATTGVVVMAFYLARTDVGTPCDAFQVKPHPSYGEIRYTDCQNLPHRAERVAGMVLDPQANCDLSSPPYHPFPADGATDVPTTVALEWSFDLPGCGDISGREDQLYFGTSPNPPWAEYVYSPHTVGPLQPGTTYYWKMFVRAYGYFGTSPVWHFTTAETIAVQPTTWGAIKALYR